MFRASRMAWLLTFSKHRSFVLVLVLPLAAMALAQAGQDTTRVLNSSGAEQPEFKGGMDKMPEWIAQNQYYPDSALNHGHEGKVYVQFTVSETGAIEDVHVLRGADPELDAEAIRLVRSMPAWDPGKLDGKAVKSVFNIPIVFKLASKSKRSARRSVHD
jgi:protein TonB